ncbi:hypothetical protein CPB84DRAFT_312697 [Gymnopilus junonius]|uniref:Uncharacterized protein n=1 Tax=Gymnopilus junonius TaxID=109634 RepID=A0A9P5TI74_GYMJU|nr:hypothetical protein CPB84DRAFT_312697 [Gymnopilus junonius]
MVNPRSESGFATEAPLLVVMCPLESLYGLDTSRPAFPQFLKILKIENYTDTACNLKVARNHQRNFSKISTKYFNVKQVPSVQKDALAKIEKELRQRYPDIFGGPQELLEKRMYYAIRVAMECHHQRRMDRANDRKSTTAQRHTIKKSVTYGKTPSPNIQKKKTVRFAHPQTGTSSNVNMIDLTLDDSDIESIDNPPAEKSPELDSKAAVQKAIKKLENESVFNASLGGKHVSQRRESFIHQFLACCDPPMVKYVQAFKDFDLATEVYLRPLVKWNSARRKDLLRSILQKVEMGSALELVIAFLDNHICVYFCEDGL